MKTIPAAFLNVDLEIKSYSDPSVLANVWQDRVIQLHADKIGRRHWRRFCLASQPGSPAAALQRFAKLVRGLPQQAGSVWAQASKEFDVGIQAGFERRSSEWLLEPELVQTIADLGARIRLTVYSPLLLMHEDAKGKRTRSRATPRT